MTRIVAYACTNDRLTGPVLRSVAEDLDLPDVAKSNGVGLAWMQNNRSLIRTNPRPGAHSPELLDLMADIPSRTMMGVLREDSSCALQPLRFRQWVFAHDGESPLLDARQDAMLEDIPEFIRGGGNTETSEVFFHVILAEILRAEIMDARAIDREVAAEAVARGVATIEHQVALADFRAVVMSKKTVIAARLGNPLSFRVIEGFEVAQEPVFAGHRPKATSHPAFRAVILTDSEPMSEGWRQVPDRSVVWFDEQWDAHFVDIA